MVVKTKKSGIPPVVLYGIAGGGAAFVTLVFAVRSVVIPEAVPMCSMRYARANTFPYATSSGQALTPIALQSKLLERDWGLVKNSNIVKTSGGPSPVVMDVTLPAGGAGGGTPTNPVSGVGFKWTPGFMQQAKRACVSYSVFLPARFKFGSGGVLPSLYGGNPNAPVENGQRAFFAPRLKWLENGQLSVQYQSPASRRSSEFFVRQRSFRMPRGRWVSVEQEVILNTVGKTDGVLRLWVDDELQIERGGMQYRTQATSGLAGVWADTHYVEWRALAWAPAPVDTKIRITPMVVRWQ